MGNWQCYCGNSLYDSVIGNTPQSLWTKSQYAYVSARYQAALAEIEQARLNIFPEKTRIFLSERHLGKGT